MARFQPGDPANERTLARRRPDAAAEQTPQHAAPLHPLLSLQRQVGNAQIARMLAQRAEEDDQLQASRVDRQVAQRAEEDDQVQAQRVDRMVAQRAEDDDQVQASRVDRMLAQRAEEDDQVQAQRVDRQIAQRAEEDDQVQAERIDRMVAQRAEEDDQVQAQRVDRQVAQRAEEDDQVQASRVDRMLAQRAEEDDQFQAKRVDRAVAQREGEPVVGPEGGEIGSDLSGAIHARRGQGSAIDEGTRSSLEGGFGTSFADVRVHTDSTSDSLNRSLGAKAFTTGSDIFFSSGAYQPGSSEGKTLLSHELAHVVQQRSMSSSGGPMRVTAAGDAHEQEADTVAQQVVSSPAPAQRQAENEE